MSDRLTSAFMFRHPAHFVALGLGAGLAPLAPGTFGTLVAIPIALLLDRYAGDVGFLAALVALFILGAWTAHVTARNLGVSDHGGIVIDEVAAFLLVLYFTGTTPARLAIAFVLFRFFDIVKPPPIRRLDATMKNGVGVMLDDVLAAGYVLILFAIGLRLFG